VLDDRPTAGAILHYAQTHNIDLIAMGTRRRGAITRLLRGGVTRRVVRGTTVPVLVVGADPEPGEGETP
jgi:nucleotide-binding universal stress UspA family protein